MIVPHWKITDTLSRDFDSAHPAGTTIIYDRIVADPEWSDGLRVRVVSPWRRPVWLSSTWLSAFRREPKRKKISA
jgi:hypothetical protein